MWICKVHAKQTVQDRLSLAKEQIRRFAATEARDTYLFVVYDRAGQTATIERFAA